MGVDPFTLALIGTAIAGTGATVYATGEQKKAGEAAGRNAEANRQAFAALQAEPEPVIPGEDVTRKARRLSIANQMRRRGRAATILTADTGGPQTLGAG